MIPDKTQPRPRRTAASSGPACRRLLPGQHEVADHRFASFLATCEPGRIVNPNPPWGAYELKKKESPLRSGVAVGTARKVDATRKLVDVGFRIAESLAVRAELRQHGDKVGGGKATFGGPGRASMDFSYDKRARGSAATLKLTYKDAAGDKAQASYRVKLPK